MKTPKLWIRNILKGSALTASLFIFQACYGPARGWDTVNIGFQTVNESGIGISGIKVEMRDQSIVTDSDGNGYFTIPYGFGSGDVTLKFTDPQGKYASRDTTLSTEIIHHSFTFKLNEQH
jgi:hypothetical protein